MKVIQIIARTAFVGKPSVDGHNELVRLRRVVKALVFVGKPQQLLLTVTAADVNKQLNESLVRCIGDLVGRVGI